MTDTDWREQIKAHEPAFKDYVKNIRHFASGPSMADILLWYDYVLWANEQAAKEPVVLEEQDKIPMPDD
jgi:hypothetical protein